MPSMHCPICQADNPPTAASCTRCSTPLPLGDETRLENFPDHTLVDEDLSGKTPGNRKSQPADDFSDSTLAADPTPRATYAWSMAADAAAAAPYGQGEELVGTLLADRYEILKLLGQGGMGAVYQARDNELERTVALKLIRPDLASNPEILRRFKQELILAREVTHRNVIRIFDLGQARGFKFITMEYVEGQDLRGLLHARGKVSPQEAVEIISQVCRALESAHAAGVVHRDLKPQNIMLDAKGRVYVMDFGIAHSLETPGMTQTGALMGTPEYMSPEQARGMKVDARSDLFALGIIFYELLTGISPYKADTAIATLLKRTQERPKPPVEAEPAIPQAISDVVMKCLEIDREQRYSNAREILEDLGLEMPTSVRTIPPTILRQPDSALKPAETIAQKSPGETPATAAGNGWRWQWIGAGVAVLLIAVAAYFLRGRWNSKPATAHAPVSVLVADFTNQTGDPIFDGTLEPMFNVALEGASFINAFNRGNARKLAQGLPKPSDKLDEQPARLVAVSQGIGAVVTGELSRRGEKYSITAQALDTVSGNVIAKTEITAENKDAVLLAIPKLAAPIRQALGDTTPESVQINEESGAFQAASLEVVHQYGLAMEQQFSGNMEAAFQSFSKAAELDPNFARAYAGMAGTSGNMGRQQDAEKYIKLAMEHVDRMAERERYRVRGVYYILTDNWQKCADEYRDLINHYPSDNLGYFNLASCNAQMRKFPEALTAVRRAVEISPQGNLQRIALSFYSSYSGDFEGGEREAQKVLQATPSHDAYLALSESQLGLGQLDKAADTYHKLEKLGTGGPSTAASGLADIASYNGRFAEAVRILEEAGAAELAAKTPESAANKFAAVAHIQILRGQHAAALDAAEKALANSQAIQIKFLVAQTFVEAGELARAQKLAAELAAVVQAEPQAYAKIIAGESALKTKDAPQAIKALTDANNLLDTWIGRFELGRADLQAGLFVEADSEFDRCIKRRGEALEILINNVPSYAYFPPVYYYQGLVRDGLKSAGFAESYRNYLNIRGPAGEDPLLPEIRKHLGN